ALREESRNRTARASPRETAGHGQQGCLTRNERTPYEDRVMGRMFDALRQADTQIDAAAAQRLPIRRDPVSTPSEPVTPEEVDDLDLASGAPFIEVGPHKSVEASPGILDTPAVAPSR